MLGGVCSWLGFPSQALILSRLFIRISELCPLILHEGNGKFFCLIIFIHCYRPNWTPNSVILLLWHQAGCVLWNVCTTSQGQQVSNSHLCGWLFSTWFQGHLLSTCGPTLGCLSWEARRSPGQSGRRWE